MSRFRNTCDHFCCYFPWFWISSVTATAKAEMKTIWQLNKTNKAIYKVLNKMNVLLIFAFFYLVLCAKQTPFAAHLAKRVVGRFFVDAIFSAASIPTTTTTMKIGMMLMIMILILTRVSKQSSWIHCFCLHHFDLTLANIESYLWPSLRL